MMPNPLKNPLLRVLLLSLLINVGLTSILEASPYRAYHQRAYGCLSMDKNEDKKIDRAEFNTHYKEAFSEIDENQDGTLTLVERESAPNTFWLKRFITQDQPTLTQPQAADYVTAQFNLSDQDQDGMLTIAECASRATGRQIYP